MEKNIILDKNIKITEDLDLNKYYIYTLSGKPSNEQRISLKENHWWWNNNKKAWSHNISEDTLQFINDFKDKYLSEKVEQEDLQEYETELTKQDLEFANRFLPSNEYKSLINKASEGEESTFFVKKIKHIAEMGNRLTENSKASDDTGLHDKGFMHYFLGSSDWYICEVDKDNFAFGFTILNGDTNNAEYGEIDLTELKSLKIGKEFQVELDIYENDSISMEHAICKKYPTLKSRLIPDIEEEIENHPDLHDDLHETDVKKDQISYTIFQVKNGLPYRDVRFSKYDETTFNIDNYDEVYTGTLNVQDKNAFDLINNKLWTDFNSNQFPSDYFGRSMSMSDIVVLNIDGIKRPYYVDRIGFTENQTITRSIEDYYERKNLKSFSQPSVSEIDNFVKYSIDGYSYMVSSNENSKILDVFRKHGYDILTDKAVFDEYIKDLHINSLIYRNDIQTVEPETLEDHLQYSIHENDIKAVASLLKESANPLAINSYGNNSFQEFAADIEIQDDEILTLLTKNILPSEFKQAFNSVNSVGKTAYEIAKDRWIEVKQEDSNFSDCPESLKKLAKFSSNVSDLENLLSPNENKSSQTKEVSSVETRKAIFQDAWTLYKFRKDNPGYTTIYDKQNNTFYDRYNISWREFLDKNNDSFIKYFQNEISLEEAVNDINLPDRLPETIKDYQPISYDSIITEQNFDSLSINIGSIVQDSNGNFWKVTNNDNFVGEIERCDADGNKITVNDPLKAFANSQMLVGGGLKGLLTSKDNSVTYELVDDKNTVEVSNNKDSATTFVLDKLKAAGIEVITDKTEFDRILESEKDLQKMQCDIEKLRELAKQKDILENQKKSVVKEKKDLTEQSFQDVVNLVTQLAFAIPLGNTYYDYQNAIVLPGGKFSLGRTTQSPDICTLMYQHHEHYYLPLCSLPDTKEELEKASFKQDGHGYFYLKEFKNYCYATNLAENLPGIISAYLETYNQKLSIDNESILQKNAELKKYFEQSKLQMKTDKIVLHDSKKLLVEILTDIATPLTEIEYSSDNYNKIFGSGIIQSPIETIKLGKNQFIRLCPPDRNNLMGAIYDTITKPSLILEKETLDSVTEDFKSVHVYGKSFVNMNNNHIRTVESIIVFKDGENIAMSLHNKGLNYFVKQIKTTDEVLYLDNTFISHLTTFIENNGGSHVVKEVKELLSSAGQIESLPFNKMYNETKLLSIKDMCKQGILHEGNLEITKDNFIKYYNIFNQNTPIYKGNPNKIASDLFNYHVKANNKEEMREWLVDQGYSINENNIQELMVQGNTTYGFTHDGKIYLDPEIMNSNVAVHEYTHLWDKYTQNTNPDLWEKGKAVFSKTHLWEDVKNDPNYADIASDDDLILSECHARICGEIAEKVLQNIAERDGEIAKDAVIDWDKEVSSYISESLTINDKVRLFDAALSVEDIKQFLSQPMKDLMNEKNISLEQEQNINNEIKTENISDIKEPIEINLNNLTENSVSEIDKENSEDISIESTSNLKPLSFEEKEAITHIGTSKIINDGEKSFKIFMTEENEIKTLEIEENNQKLHGKELENVKTVLGLNNFNEIVKNAENELKTTIAFASWKGFVESCNAGKTVIAVPFVREGLITEEPLITYSSGIAESRKIANQYIKSWNIQDSKIGQPFVLSREEVLKHNEKLVNKVQEEYIKILEQKTKEQKADIKPEIEYLQISPMSESNSGNFVAFENFLEKQLGQKINSEIILNSLDNDDSWTGNYYVAIGRDANNNEDLYGKFNANDKYEKIDINYLLERSNYFYTEEIERLANESSQISDSIYEQENQEDFDFNNYYIGRSPEDLNTIDKEISYLQKNQSYVESIQNFISKSLNNDIQNNESNIEKESSNTENLKPRQSIEIRSQIRDILENNTDDEIRNKSEFLELLSQYEGGGGLSNENNRTPSEILNAYYTPRQLIDSVWKLVDHYAPNGKTVLEPSSGIGRFAENRPNNLFTLHEIDETSSRIAKILHPEATVNKGAYQKQFFDESERILNKNYVQPKYDIVIGNPPYGDYVGKYKGLGEGKEFSRYEEYFISKGIDALKDDNSVLAFVVPSAFLNSYFDSAKEIIANKGILIDAFRLPAGIFPTTEVGTDIVLIKKGISTTEQQQQFANGNYFTNHPEKILGEVKTRINRFGKEEEYTSIPESKTVQDELQKIDNFIKADIAESTVSEKEEQINPNATKDVQKENHESIKKTRQKKEKWNIKKSIGEVMNSEEFARLYGKKLDIKELPIWRVTNWEGKIDTSKLKPKELETLLGSSNFIQEMPGQWTHKELFRTGDLYAKIEKYKILLQNNTDNNYKELFQKNISILEQAAKPPVPLEKIHLGVQTTFAENFMLNVPNEDGTTTELSMQEAFILWATGNSPDSDEKSRYNIDYATANISRDEMPENVTWFDIVNYIDKVPVKADKTYKSYGMDEEEYKELKSDRAREADNKRLARHETADKLFNDFIQQGITVSDKERFVYEYNKRFNSYVAPDYSNLPLFIDGMSAFKGSEHFKLYDQQIKGISFMCNKGNGLLAYDVGLGKTACGIVATVNQIQSGRSKRPLIVVPNQVYSKWYTDIRQLFPNIKINDLYNMNAKSISKYQNAENPHALTIPEGSISLCTREALNNITFTDESCRTILYEEFSNLISDSNEKTDRQNAVESDKIEQAIGTASQVKNPSYVFFEDCKFDHVTVDEAHNFNNLWTMPKPKTKGSSNEYSGIPSGVPSARAKKMYAITQYIQNKNDNRNVFMLTATPFTNSPTQVYSMLKYIGAERLKEQGIGNLSEFMDYFAKTKYELSVSADNQLKNKQVMKSWDNLPELQSLLQEFMDKKGIEETDDIVRPALENHKIELNLTDIQRKIMEQEEEKMRSNESPAAAIVAMGHMRLAAISPALLDNQYKGINLPPLSKLVESSPKLTFVCNSVIDMYKTNKDKGQFIYLPLGKDAHGMIKEYLVKNGIPKEAVEIINGEKNNSVEKKEKITSEFNDKNKKLKILIGGANTSEGIDLNGNSFVLYNCSLGWNPTETIQVTGRIQRQGNEQGRVHAVYPLMIDSIDAVLYQKHDEKINRIDALWTFKGEKLDVDDTINPEIVKFELIKDPTKKANLLLENQTKEQRAELSKVELKTKNADEIYEKYIELVRNIKQYRNRITSTQSLSDSFKAKNQTVPEYIKLELQRSKKDVVNNEKKLETVTLKITALGIDTTDINTIKDGFNKYIHELNQERNSLNQQITEKEKELPKIIEEMKLKYAEEKILAKSGNIQSKELCNKILSNLVPMSEYKEGVLNERFFKKLDTQLERKEINNEEYNLYKKAGRRKYKAYMDGEISSLDEEIPNENEVKKEQTKKATIEVTKIADSKEPEKTDNTKNKENEQMQIVSSSIAESNIVSSEAKQFDLFAPEEIKIQTIKVDLSANNIPTGKIFNHEYIVENKFLPPTYKQNDYYVVRCTTKDLIGCQDKENKILDVYLTEEKFKTAIKQHIKEEQQQLFDEGKPERIIYANSILASKSQVALLKDVFPNKTCEELKQKYQNIHKTLLGNLANNINMQSVKTKPENLKNIQIEKVKHTNIEVRAM